MYIYHTKTQSWFFLLNFYLNMVFVCYFFSHLSINIKSKTLIVQSKKQNKVSCNNRLSRNIQKLNINRH